MGMTARYFFGKDISNNITTMLPIKKERDVDLFLICALEAV
jgi:hypothetical protein